MFYSEMIFTLVQFYFAWFILIFLIRMPFFDKMSQKAKCRFFLLCTVVHAVCSIVYFEINDNKFNYIKTEGSIVSKFPTDKKTVGIRFKGSKFEKSYYVYKVEYNADGKTYHSNQYESLDYIFKGRKVDVYYKKNNPDKIWENSLDVSIRADLFGNIIFVIIYLAGYITHRPGKNEKGKDT